MLSDITMRSKQAYLCPHQVAPSGIISYGASVANLQRLADYVVTRRTELDWSQETLAAKSGLRTVTLSDIETAKDRDRRPTTLAKLERALGWRPGSARAVLAGGEPELIDQPTSGTPVSDERFRELMRRRAEMVAWIAEIDDEIQAGNTGRVV